MRVKTFYISPSGRRSVHGSFPSGGSDYAAIEIFLNAWVEDRPTEQADFPNPALQLAVLREDEASKIKEIEAKQQTEWSQLLKTWEQRKNEWVDNQLVEAARERYGYEGLESFLRLAIHRSLARGF